MTPSTNCLQCGVCCHSDSPTFVRVTGADWSRLNGEAERVAHFIGHRAFMRMAEGHCAALAIRPAADTTAAAGALEYFCTVYEQRPQICRDLARGSAECQGELASKALSVHGHR